MRRVVLVLILIVRFISACSQGRSEIDLSHPNLSLIERETFAAVNDLRAKRKLAAVRWDNVLYRAAKDHADYLINEKGLSHNQRSNDKFSPFKRVKLHGGLVYTSVGENLVSATLGTVLKTKGKQQSTQSYKSTALTLAVLWKASPPHYRNILEKSFNTSALAVAYDPVSHRLVAVQVFGHATALTDEREQPDHAQELLKVAGPKLPFGLKNAEVSGKINNSAAKAFRLLRGKSGYLVGSYKNGKRAFKGRRSGIAIEWIPLAQFDSGARDYTQVRNRRNGLFSLNGELTKPVYRRELLRYSRRMSPRRLFLDLKIVQIYKREKRFIYPLVAGSGSNIFLISKKRLVTYTTPVSLPSELLHEPLPALKFKNSFITVAPTQKFRVEKKSDSLEVKVFYASGAIAIDTATSRRIIRALEQVRGKVIRVEASAYASIDGDMTDNQELAKQRAREFMSLVRPYLDTVTVVPTVTTKEQWKLFLTQIAVPELSHLKNLDRRALRDYVNAHKKDSVIARLLTAQRFTLFKMVIRRDSVIPLPIENAIDNYYKERKRFSATTRKTVSLAGALEDAQLKAYGEMLSKNKADTLSIVRHEYFPALRYHDVMFSYLGLGSTDDHFYWQLHSLSGGKYFSSTLKSQRTYNNLVLIYRNFFGQDQLSFMLDATRLHCKNYRESEFLFRNHKRLSCRTNKTTYPATYYMLKEFPHLINSSRTQNLPRAHTDSLLRFYTASMINVLYAPVLPGEIFTHVANVKSQFHPSDNALTLDERLRLALFYCAFDRTQTANDLLGPVINDVRLSAEARKLYITLQLDRYNEMHDFITYFIAEYTALGKEAWCSMLTEGKYLNYLLLDDLTLKKFYNCNCQ